jgi:hypothetical protein
LASGPKRTTGKHHEKGDHLCCRWTDKLGENNVVVQIETVLEKRGREKGKWNEIKPTDLERRRPCQEQPQYVEAQA